MPKTIYCIWTRDHFKVKQAELKAFVEKSEFQLLGLF
jgi:hypothetical protein